MQELLRQKDDQLAALNKRLDDKKAAVTSWVAYGKAQKEAASKAAERVKDKKAQIATLEKQVEQHERRAQQTKEAIKQKDKQLVNSQMLRRCADEKAAQLAVQLNDSRAAVKKLEQHLKAIPGTAANVAEIIATYKRRLDAQKAEAKVEYAKKLSNIQQLQNTVFQLKFGAVS